METLFQLLGDGPLGEFMRSNRFMFPAMEITHFIGLTLLFGVMIIVDLRIVGAFKPIPYASVFKLLPIAIAGFLLNLVSGLAFIATNPDLYFSNIAFWLKMGLVVLGGLNALWFTVAELRPVSALAANNPAPSLARAMAGVSLAFWTGVIVLGRLLPTFAGVGGG